MFASGSRVLIRKSYWSLKRRGVLGSFSHALARPFRKQAPAWSRTASDQASDEDFDAKFGVQTAGIVALKGLDLNDSSWVYGVDYEPTSEDQFKRLMAELPEDLSDYTFVDFGSGKGKALLLAAALNFRQVIGVEFAEQLHAIAEANIKSYSGPRLARHVESICIDATKFELPEGPLVLYFYNPFEREVMERVIQNIRRSLGRGPRPIYVALSYPRLLDMFLTAGFDLIYREDNSCLLEAGRKP